jgi:hypothetical protein
MITAATAAHRAERRAIRAYVAGIYETPGVAARTTGPRRIERLGEELTAVERAQVEQAEVERTSEECGTAMAPPARRRAI